MYILLDRKSASEYIKMRETNSEFESRSVRLTYIIVKQIIN